MFIVSKAFLILSSTVIVRAGGTIWLNPFATVLFTVCVVTLCFVPVLRGCVWYVCCYVRKKALLRGGIWACMRCPCLCRAWDGDYVSQIPYVWYYVSVKSSFQQVSVMLSSSSVHSPFS